MNEYMLFHTPAAGWWTDTKSTLKALILGVFISVLLSALLLPETRGHVRGLSVGP